MARVKRTPKPPAHGDAAPRRWKSWNRFRDLLERGTLTEQQLEHALGEQERTGKSLGRVLLELGYITEEDVPRVMARSMGYEFVDLEEYPIDPEAAALIPLGTARRHEVVGIGFKGDQLVIAVSDPANVILVDDLKIMTDRDLEVVVAAQQDIRETLDRLEALDRSAQELLEADETEEEVVELGARAEEAPIVKAVNRIITQAVQMRASDIHVEPEERDVRVRYRIDGVLHEMMRLPKSHQQGVMSRLKVMSDANIAEKRLPQDGRVSVTVEGKAIDLRVATLPSVYGEEVAIRILDRASSLLTLTDLGLSPDALKRWEKSIQQNYGAVLITGPTGSGKSTTLYSSLNVLNDPAKKIITVEDPVEYRLQGLRQLQVHPHIGLTFASALRSILRSDPDVIMVGEIRDRETASIAIHSAMTGHLVLTTLHTNDAPTATTRLVEMGVEPFLVASAVRCVMAQRLARIVCPRCAEEYVPDLKVLEQVGLRLEGKAPKLKRAVGCRFCAETGYRGRVALAEVLVISEEIERMIAERAATDDIRRMALEQGMQTLREDGFRKVAEGVTTIEEVLRALS